MNETEPTGRADATGMTGPDADVDLAAVGRLHTEHESQPEPGLQGGQGTTAQDIVPDGLTNPTTQEYVAIEGDGQAGRSADGLGTGGGDAEVLSADPLAGEV